MPDDTRFANDFLRHPKTLLLKSELGLEGFWSLMSLLFWVSDNRPTGDLAGLSWRLIEIAADWHGAEGAFIHALVACAFLDGAEGEYRVHDWAERNPWAASRPERIRRNREAANARWHPKGEPNALGNASRNARRNANDALHDALPHSYSTPTHSPEKKDPPTPHEKREASSEASVYARGVLENLQIPITTLMLGIVSDSIRFRTQQTGNPAEAEATFIVNQGCQWRASPDGQHNPRMSWATWFQGAHYNDDPATWRGHDGDKGKARADRERAAINRALYGTAEEPLAN